MATATFPETASAVNRTPVLSSALTARRNRKLVEEGQDAFATPACQLWWVVLVFEGEDETRPVKAHWCFSEDHADQEAVRYQDEGRMTQICAAYAA